MGMTINRSGFALPLALFTVAFACDPGSKSVSGTATADGGDDGDDDGASTGDGGDGDGGDGDGGDGVSATSNPSGDDGMDDPGNPGEPLCLESSTPIATSDEITPLGFPADDVIAVSNGWSTTFGWFPPDGPITVVPAGTETTVNIGLTYDGGTITYVDSEPNPDNTLDIVPDCDDRLEIEFDVTFSTADGRFDEAFVTTAVATEPGALSFRQSFGPHGFSGTFSSDEVTFADENGSVEGFELGGAFSLDEPPTGTLAIEVLVDGNGPDGGFAGFGIIASWPSGLPE